MNADETIAAGIERLESLKRASSPGHWIHAQRVPEFSQIEAPGLAATPVALIGLARGDGDLIVALHRTVDAQLRVLRLDAKLREAKRPPYSLAALDLARAIIGEAS